MAKGRETSVAHLSKDQQHHNQQPLGHTPPDRQCPLLPSPPTTTERLRAHTSTPDQLPERLIHHKRRTESGKEVRAYAKFKVDRELFASLSATIERSFRRVDYEPGRERLIIRMPSPVHDFFLTSFADELLHQLKSIGKRDTQAAAFVSQIKSGGSSAITMDASDSRGPGAKLTRQPDAQFQHKEAVFPSVVVEVSYSQDGKNLPRLAQSYILNSNGGIKAVIGIDINYSGRMPSTVSLWRAKLSHTSSDPEETLLEITQDLDALPFRSFDRQIMNSQASVDLNLHDFATDRQPSTCAPIALSISLTKICHFLDEAEQMQRARQRKDGRAVEPAPPTRKRKLFSSSPIESLTSSDPDRSSEEERAIAQDATFESPRSKRKV